jgi:hypothetical protein
MSFKTEVGMVCVTILQVVAMVLNRGDTTLIPVIVIVSALAGLAARPRLEQIVQEACK